MATAFKAGIHTAWGLTILIALGVLAGLASAAVPLDEALAEASRYRGWDVTSFEVTGLEQPLAGTLKAGLALNGKRGLLRTRRPPFFAQVLADDVLRTRAFVAQRGFPWAEVRVAYRPDNERRQLGLTLEVVPGRAAVIDSLLVTGIPGDVGAASAVDRLLVRGRRFVEADLAAAVVAAQDAMASAGYPFAAVKPQVSLRDSTRVSIRLVATPGPHSVFATTLITGADDDLRDLVLRSARPSDGEQFTPAALSRARRNVRELDLFRRVDVSVGEPRDGTVDLRVDVVPRKPRSAEIDLGYWTDDFLRLGARWRHRNLLGGGRGAELKGTLSRFRRDGALSVWWLSLFGPRTRLSARLRYAMELEDGYELTSTQAELWGSKRVGQSGQIQIGTTVANVDLDVMTADEDAFLAESGLLTSLHLRTNLDRVDDLVDPRRGVSWSAYFEWSPPWLPSDNSFAAGTASIAWYRPVAGAVLATRIEGGLAGPLGESLDLLPNKRFFAGGSSTMRGARRRMLGPLDSAGDPIGGEALLIGSTELRIPIKGILRAALFADVGNVWRFASDVVLDDLALAVGPGLMIDTPVGPIRADVGFRLTTRPAGEPNVVLHVAVGHPF